MAAELITFKLTGEWDGSTPISTGRDDITVEGTTRFYEGAVNGSIIAADYFGLFSRDAPKLVSIAIEGGDPAAIARVVASGSSPDDYREQVDLTNTYRSVFVGARDLLYIRAPNRAIVWMMVNELNEPESVAFARTRLRNEDRVRRFRITRSDTNAWTPNTTPMALTFAYNATSGYTEATTALQGSLPIKSLFANRDEGAYLWVRAGNIGANTLEIFNVHPIGLETQQDQASLPAAKWSDPIWVGWDDVLAFRTGAPPAGKSVVLDFELSKVRNRR